EEGRLPGPPLRLRRQGEGQGEDPLLGPQRLRRLLEAPGARPLPTPRRRRTHQARRDGAGAAGEAGARERAAEEGGARLSEREVEDAAHQDRRAADTRGAAEDTPGAQGGQ